jgi:hypothetical protein
MVVHSQNPRFSGHNKPEAFWMFAQSDPSIATRRHLVYVEDCADHILNFEHAFRRVFSSRNDNDNNTNNNANERSTIDDIAATASTTTTTTTVAAAAGGVESEPDVLSSVDSRQFAFEDATLLFWPPALEDGFETLERHSADAHERLIARCGAESAQLKT